MIPSPVDKNNYGPSFVVFSDDWAGHPSSCQHLFRHVAAKHQVLWVNTIGMRRPTVAWSDLRKACEKISRMVRRSRQDSRGKADNLGLQVCQPFMLPFNSIALVRKFNQYSVTRAALRHARELNMVRPILVATVPNACDYVGFLEEGRVIYYCVDDFAQWPGLEQDLVDEMEEQLIAKADVLVATSQNLYQKLAISGKRTHLLAHGVDLSLFTQEAPMEHECLAGIPRPRAGYFGLFDGRSDQSVIATVASQMKGFSFVITGPVATDVATLRAHSNIFFTGSVPYAQLPALVKGLDVLFIPYVVNEFTDSISPLKLKEYLVTGKPVIATPITEATLQRQFITIASTVDEWQGALQSALLVDIAARRQSISAVMANETWADKAVTFLSICTDTVDSTQLAVASISSRIV